MHPYLSRINLDACAPEVLRIVLVEMRRQQVLEARVPVSTREYSRHEYLRRVRVRVCACACACACAYVCVCLCARVCVCERAFGSACAWARLAVSVSACVCACVACVRVRASVPASLCVNVRQLRWACAWGYSRGTSGVLAPGAGL